MISVKHEYCKLVLGVLAFGQGENYGDCNGKVIFLINTFKGI